MRKVVEQVNSVDSSQCMCIYCNAHDVAHALLNIVICMCPYYCVRLMYRHSNIHRTLWKFAFLYQPEGKRLTDRSYPSLELLE